MCGYYTANIIYYWFMFIRSNIMEMPEVVTPDFEEWADRLVESGTINDVYTGKVMLNSFPCSLEEALQQAFEQGYNLGLNKGWAIEQDKEYANKEGGKA